MTETKFSHSFTFWARRPNQLITRIPHFHSQSTGSHRIERHSLYWNAYQATFSTQISESVSVCVRTFTNCQKYRNRPSTALIENKAKIQVCGVCACVCETWRKRVCACQYTVDFSTFQESTLYCCSDLFLVSCSLLIRYRDGLAVVVKSVHFESVLSSCVKRSFSSRARLYRNGPWHSLNSWAVEVPKSIHHWRLPDSDIDLRKTDFSGGANLVRGWW